MVHQNIAGFAWRAKSEQSTRTTRVKYVPAVSIGTLLLLGQVVFVTCAEAQDGSAVESRTATPHAHYHSHPHPTVADATRFTTNRSRVVDLPLPAEKDAFVFGVFGDRTGGQPEGIEILKQAVADVNLFEPDLVMTVGDLVQGYNETESWLAQTSEYKSVMSGLLCPWFPVAGNHDIYWRGANRPEGEHEENYEMHFGPLWYAFEHKDCWFIVLYSDEGDPETGEKNFNLPQCQKMSDAQFSWLKETLERAKSATHVFLFLHHPRWLGKNYGDDWEKVHAALVAAGNVRVVFGGHIHRMRYDGPRDGIEYVTLATVGGGQSGFAPRAGFLHHYHLVTVRKQQIAMSSVPVGEAMDVRAITGTMSEEVDQLAQAPPTFRTRPRIKMDGVADGPMVVEVFNPTSRPVEFELLIDSKDPRWAVSPDHRHQQVYPGQRTRQSFVLRRMETIIDDSYEPPELVINADYLAETARIALVERRIPIPIAVQIPIKNLASQNMAASISEGNCFNVDSASLELPDGPMTLECWFKANTFGTRTALVAKTERSEFGIFVSNGLPYFTIFLGNGYVEPQADEPLLEVGVWHHVAGVFDGQEVRTYLDGKLVSRGEGAGKRKTNSLPLMIGADVDGRGKATSFFDGQIDAVRLSRVARYTKDSFLPMRKLQPDKHSALMLNFDQLTGPFAADESEQAAHAVKVGQPELVLVNGAPLGATNPGAATDHGS